MLNAYFVWSNGTRLERRLAALRAEGEPVQIADFAHEPIPPETNAETYLRRAGNDLDAIQKELIALYPKSAYPRETPSPADREKLETLFAVYPNFMPLLEQAAACPDYDPQFDVTLSPTRFLQPYMDRIGDYRTLGRVLRAYSALRLSQGRPDDAIAAQLLMLRLTRIWHRDPVLMGYLVTLACKYGAMDAINQVLQAGPPSPDSRRAIDAELSLHDDLDGLRWALRSERAYSLSSIREMLGSGYWPPRIFTDDVMLGVLDLVDYQLENTSRPYAEAVSRTYASEPRGGLPNPFRPLVTLLEPALASARQAADRSRALVRSLRILNALQSHAMEGDPTPDLADLGLPADTTIDPFNGEPLHVEKLPEGWLVYSVGPDGVDDGGKLDGKADFGFGPTGLNKRVQPE